MIAGDLSGEEEALRYFNRISDKTAATKARYDFYLKKSNYNTRNFNADMGEKALIEIKSLEKVPEYAQQVLWPKAVILDRLKQYEPAIKAYKAANKQPQSTWAVADCLIKLQQYDKAILTVRGLESIGGNVAAQACFKISEIYKLTKNKTKEIEQLRMVLRRYPESRESSAAHLRLEALGAKITGGKAKANE